MGKFPIILATLTLAGCTVARPARTAATGNAIARIDARAEGIETNADRLVVFTGDAGKPLLDVVKTDAGKIRVDAAEAQRSNEQAASEFSDLTQRYDKLRFNSFVRGALWVQRALWIVPLIWALLGAAGVALLAFSPLGAVGLIGRQILNFLPLSTPFTATANWIKQRQA